MGYSHCINRKCHKLCFDAGEDQHSKTRLKQRGHDELGLEAVTMGVKRYKLNKN